MWIESTCDCCGMTCREIDLTDINDTESYCEDCYEKLQRQQLLEEVYSEIEIADPVGYGEVQINPEDFKR